MSTQASSTDPKFKNVQAIANVLESPPRGKSAGAVRALRNSARFAWHMGLGTVVTLEEKVVELTRDFAQKGERVETKVRTALRERAKQVTPGAGRHSRGSKLDSAIDHSVNRSLHLLGVPSRQDIVQLEQLVEDMSAAVAQLVQLETEGKGAAASKTPKAS